MRGKLTALLAILAPLVLPAASYATGDTVRIIIEGVDLAAPIEVADSTAIARFNVWTGAGTGPNEAQGMIVDWSQEVSAPPQGLRIYFVSIVTNRSSSGPHVYGVSYSLDPSTNEGYVYIPARTDPRWRDNVWLIIRGVEGRWFRAWEEWEDFAHPLIDKADKIPNRRP